MPRYRLDDKAPTVESTAFVAPDAAMVERVG